MGPRLNLGCGSTVAPGWVNIDRSPGPLLDRAKPVKQLLFRIGVISSEHMSAWPKGIVRLDISKGLPYPSGSVEAVYSSHTLEHLYLEEARKVLKEIHRVLRPSGILRLALPDSESLIKEFVRLNDSDPVEAGLRLNAGLMAHPLERPKRRGLLSNLFTGRLHRWQPTPGLVKGMLRDAGFQQVERKGFRESIWHDIDEVEHRENSFFLEATKIAPA